ncbi:oligosaccharide flippase family protein [Pseudooceanicola onchidii]|uniref:oligosaccharide flippase family protein n=1 Tax=Pseudooceanicola onchidii TaxID=2562279 RepID=UPI0010AA4CBE|nr:oligosaccharide flippase family protein [Pseudooceanicola onchidii]
MSSTDHRDRQDSDGEPDARDLFFDVSALRDGLSGTAGHSTMMVLGFSIMKILIALGSTAVLARLVLPAEQGLAALAIPFVMVAAGLSEFGLAQAVVQRRHITHREVSTLFWIGMLIGCCVTLMFALIATPVARFFDTPDLVPIFRVLSLYVLFSVLAAHYVSILRRRMQIRMIEVSGFGAALASAVLAAVAAWMGAGAWALLIQLLGAEVLNFATLAIRSKWLPSWPDRAWRRDLSTARSALNFGGFLAAERVVMEVMHNLQTVLVGRVFSQLEAGLFFRSQTISRMPQRRVVSPMSGVFLPTLSRVQDDPAGFRAIYHRQVSRGNLVIVPLGLILCSCADVISGFLLGPDWAATAPIMAVMGGNVATSLSLSSLAWCLVATGHSKQFFLARLLINTFLVIAMVLGLQQGLLGMVTYHMIAATFVQGPILAVVAVWLTPLTWGAIRQTLLVDSLVAVAALLAMLALRATLELDMVIIEAALAIAIMMLIYAVRIALNPGIRKDVLKALRIGPGRQARTR